jgi:hypothetical protein
MTVITNSNGQSHTGEADSNLDAREIPHFLIDSVQKSSPLDHMWASLIQSTLSCPTSNTILSSHSTP